MARSAIGSPSDCGGGGHFVASLAHNHERGLKAVVDLELIKNIGEVGFYGFLADENLFTDLFVGEALGYQPQNFLLSFRQAIENVIVFRFAGFLDLSLGDFFERFRSRQFLVNP